MAERQPEQLATAMAAADIGQHLRLQLPAREGGKVGRMAQLVRGGAVDIGTGIGAHVARGVALVVGRGHQIGGDVIERGQLGGHGAARGK
ncbi:hypothetical protein D3C72_2232150 [compost metagenome]